MNTTKKISQLPLAGPVTGNELLPLNQAGDTKQIALASLDTRYVTQAEFQAAITSASKHDEFASDLICYCPYSFGTKKRVSDTFYTYDITERSVFENPIMNLSSGGMYGDGCLATTGTIRLPYSAYIFAEGEFCFEMYVFTSHHCRLNVLNTGCVQNTNFPSLSLNFPNNGTSLLCIEKYYGGYTNTGSLYNKDIRNTWAHICMEKYCGVMSFYINGQCVHSHTHNLDMIPGASNVNWYVDQMGSAALKINDFRMTRRARYKGEFVPNTSGHFPL